MIQRSPVDTYQRRGWTYSTEDGGSMLLRNAGANVPEYTVS
jgi:hypothetical protein